MKIFSGETCLRNERMIYELILCKKFFKRKIIVLHVHKFSIRIFRLDEFFLKIIHRLLWFTVISYRNENYEHIDFLFFLIYGSYDEISFQISWMKLLVYKLIWMDNFKLMIILKIIPTLKLMRYFFLKIIHRFLWFA